ncbi:hypothetical protein Pfl01_3840 [Pseudomonas fluorescens Pf0-1]|uniref:Uncharacterized protein n=1 Tax=Pseudomonas fluorescens (strain Pf0-1) TaxID=205922 RepID=Q3K9H7_PSEPF|nr:hypothetical protein Pfl01_3840 [Pseudomonas fluorescens Pf0-1]
MPGERAEVRFEQALNQQKRQRNRDQFLGFGLDRRALVIGRGDDFEQQQRGHDHQRDEDHLTRPGQQNQLYGERQAEENDHRVQGLRNEVAAAEPGDDQRFGPLLARRAQFVVAGANR